MSTITLAGNEVQKIGSLPEKGTKAPHFSLVANDLSEVNDEDFAGKRIVHNVSPPVATDVGVMPVRRFNKIAAELPNTVVVCASKDLPFALARFCGADGIDNAVTASAFRSTFGEDYGVTMTTGPLAGLLSRAVVIVEPDGTVSYTQQVPEIHDEPDYELVMEALEQVY